MSVERERASLNKVSTFSGKEEDFPQWWLGFFTHVTVMGVSEALDSAFDLPTICTGNDLSDEVVDKVKKNAKVINSFVAYFIKSATLMRIIAYAQDDGCPVGRAWKVKERRPIVSKGTAPIRRIVRAVLLKQLLQGLAGG